jgi:hypothetical protein
VLKHHVDFLDLGQRCVVFMSKPAQHDMFFFYFTGGGLDTG